MMAAISTKLHNPNYQVILLERNAFLGLKLKMTGGGRCNVTANLDVDEFIQNYPSNGKFLYSSLVNFGSKEVIKFFNENNCPLKEEEHNKMFPVSNKGSDIVNTLVNKAQTLGVKIILNTFVNDINYQLKEIHTNDFTKTYNYDYLIIATGGITYPKTGSDGTGHVMASKLGHNIIKLKPTQSPLVSSDYVITTKQLTGLSFKDVSLSCYNDKSKLVKKIKGDLIFTHFGLSGPAPIMLSYYVAKELVSNSHVKVTIDFLSNISLDELLTLNSKELDEAVKLNKIPKRLVDYIINEGNITLFKQFNLNISDIRGINNAFLTDGGISIKEINPKTMKSKIDNNVSFCGEIIDFFGYTGGFNITAALSTGYSAGKNIRG